MILNVPNQKLFRDNGILFLNLAWDITSDILLEISEVAEWDDELPSGDDSHFLEELAWEKVEHKLSNALVLVQQGLEFLLKADIAGVSPYLLISNSTREWPKKSSLKDIDFSEYRTIDAQDLVTVHDAVAGQRLSEDFKELVKTLRKKRNLVMHTVTIEKPLRPLEIWKYILITLKNLAKNENWVDLRKSYLDDRNGVFVDPCFSEERIAWESYHLIGILTNTEQYEYLGITKKRKYICLDCSKSIRQYRHITRNIKTAQLCPNTSDSNTVRCRICGVSTTVRREDCIHKDCKGNVIDELRSVCLACGRASIR